MGEAMFCGQQPYLPLGTLRTALAYPSPAETLSDDVAIDTLRAVQLGHLADRLDVETDWSKTLSPGEQQRLAFGRILISRPCTGIFRRDHLRARRGHGARHLRAGTGADARLHDCQRRPSEQSGESPQQRAHAARRGSVGDSERSLDNADVVRTQLRYSSTGVLIESGEPLFASDHEDRPSFGVRSGRLHAQFAQQCLGREILWPGFGTDGREVQLLESGSDGRAGRLKAEPLTPELSVASSAEYRPLGPSRSPRAAGRHRQRSVPTRCG